jgi:hypothetical protein
MIEESLLKTGIAGKDGFVWWIGQVAQQKSWKSSSQFLNEKGANGEVWASRCKVRIVGYHTFDGGILPDDDLPWAQIMMDPTFGSAQGGMGSTNNLKGGETCFGFFLDGDEAQQPVIIGLLYRSDGVKNLIDEKSIEKEKSSKFKPFTGHPGNVIQSTQRTARPTKTNDPINPISETPVSDSSTEVRGLPQFGDRLILDGASSLWQVAKKADITTTIPNGCQNNLIGQISQSLQSFVAITNGLDKYLNVYIDPVLNEITNIASQIKNTARSIVGVIKLIINTLRNTIFKCITWAFRKLVGLIVPAPQQTIVLEAMKKILDIIFCALEKIPGVLFDFIGNLLNDLVDTTLNVPACASEQMTAGILAQLMDLIDSLMTPILSGINWLTGGIGTISGILNQASSLASQIFSFLECSGLACKQPYEWAAKFGPSEKEADDWKKMVEKTNVFRTVSSRGSRIEDAIRQTSLYSGTDVLGERFGGLIDNALASPNCSSEVINPQTQTNMMSMPIGNRWAYCIPPEVYITGDGIGAEAVAIVNPTGEIFSVEVASGGAGYVQDTTTVRVVDNSGYGFGAIAKPIINEQDGSITSIYLTNIGYGYCQGNISNASETTSGIGSFVSGSVTDIIVISPGYGYTSGDKITDGKNNYTPIVSPGSGAIVKVTLPNNPIGGFTKAPTLTINTNTGVGAELIPLTKFTPSYVGIGYTTVKTGIAVTSVIDCVGK